MGKDKHKKGLKKECCLKFIRKDKHCSRCPATNNAALREELMLAYPTGRRPKGEKDKRGH